jgi:hypothetical protein
MTYTPDAQLLSLHPVKVIEIPGMHTHHVARDVCAEFPCAEGEVHPMYGWLETHALRLWIPHTSDDWWLVDADTPESVTSCLLAIQHDRPAEAIAIWRKEGA